MYAFQSNCKLHIYKHKDILMKRLLISSTPTKRVMTLGSESVLCADRHHGLVEQA